MKRHLKITAYVCALILGCVASSSCNDWLSATSSDKLASDKLFSEREGYLSSLTGIYLLMADPACYGKNYTWYVNDLLSYPFADQYILDNTFGSIQHQTYTQEGFKSTILQMWRSSYNAIANINMLLRNIEGREGILNAREKDLIVGELLSLRAFLHFDLARSFGNAFTDKTIDSELDKLTIPYVTEYSMEATPQSTYRELFEKIDQDLSRGLELLGGADPIVTGEDVPGDTEEYWTERTTHLNYYAAQMLKARILLWKGQTSEAGALAREIIEKFEMTPQFAWFDETLADNLITDSSKDKDYTFPSEHLFSLYAPEVGSCLSPYVSESSSFYPHIMLDIAFTNSLFLTEEYDMSGAEDIRGPRLMLHYAYGSYLSRKLDMCLTNPNARLPLMKISELYLIAAEAYALEKNLAEAINYCDMLRSRRGVSKSMADSWTDLDENVVDNSQEEFFKIQWIMNKIGYEYMREFISEGQYYYFARRSAYPKYIGQVIFSSFSPRLLRLPFPDAEINYGRVQQ